MSACKKRRHLARMCCTKKLQAGVRCNGQGQGIKPQLTHLLEAGERESHTAESYTLSPVQLQRVSLIQVKMRPSLLFSLNLDFQIERKEGKLSTGVYRKITHTDRNINYASHHHSNTKTGVIACLRNRAEKVCDQQSLESELSHLKKTFEVNGYPPSLITRELHREPPQPTQSNTNDQENKDQKVIYLPYVQRTAEHI